MESSSLKKENVIKDVRNFFMLKKEIDDIAIKDIRNLFILKKENKVIKDRILRGIINFLRIKKKKKISVNQEDKNYFRVIIILNILKNYQLKISY